MIYVDYFAFKQTNCLANNWIRMAEKYKMQSCFNKPIRALNLNTLIKYYYTKHIILHIVM